MNDFFTTSCFTDAVWANNPFGMAAIGVDGNVYAVNLSFEYCTGITGEAVLGMSEADFSQALINRKQQTHRRFQIASESLRAMYYFSSAPSNDDDSKPAYIAEQLREPLASIYGFSELLLTQNYDNQTRLDLAALILVEAELMANIINNQLIVSDSEHATNINESQKPTQIAF